MRRRVTRTSQSVGHIESDLGNQITRGLTALYDFSQNTPENSANFTTKATKVWINSIPTISVGRQGKGVSLQIDSLSTNAALVILDDSEFPTDKTTILYIRRPRDTTSRAAAHFGGIASELDERLFAHVPFSDGNIYWDYGDPTGTGRTTWTGYTKVVGQVDTFVFLAGARGGAIWLNGEQKATNGTASTRNSTSDGNKNFYIGDGLGLSNYAGDAVDVLYFAVWNRELSDAEVRSVSANPYQLLQPITQYIPTFVPAVGGVTVMNQLQGSNMGADLYNGTIL